MSQPSPQYEHAHLQELVYKQPTDHLLIYTVQSAQSLAANLSPHVFSSGAIRRDVIYAVISLVHFHPLLRHAQSAIHIAHESSYDHPNIQASENP